MRNGLSVEQWLNINALFHSEIIKVLPYQERSYELREERATLSNIAVEASADKPWFVQQDLK